MEFHYRCMECNEDLVMYEVIEACENCGADNLDYIKFTSRGTMEDLNNELGELSNELESTRLSVREKEQELTIMRENMANITNRRKEIVARNFINAGTRVRLLVDSFTREKFRKTTVKKGTIGTVVEIWDDDIRFQESLTGVYHEVKKEFVERIEWGDYKEYMYEDEFKKRGLMYLDYQDGDIVQHDTTGQLLICRIEEDGKHVYYPSIHSDEGGTSPSPKRLSPVAFIVDNKVRRIVKGKDVL